MNSNPKIPDGKYMEMLKTIRTASRCTRRSVAAILVDKNGDVIGSGYNGPILGIHKCTKDNCLRTLFNIPSGERQELCWGAHAETEAICEAAALGKPTKGATLYCTTYPCSYCAKVIVRCGIKRVVYGEGYEDHYSETILSAIKTDKYVAQSKDDKNE